MPPESIELERVETEAGSPEIPFHVYGADGSHYSVDVIRDRRDETDPHYDVDLVRSTVGRFGETLEQRLTLGEYAERSEADEYRQTVEDTLSDQGLAGLGDAEARIQHAPMLLDGLYLFASYPPAAEPEEPSAAHRLYLDHVGLQTEPLAHGTAEAMEQVVADHERAWLDGLTLLDEPAIEAAPFNPLPEQPPQYHFDYNRFGEDALVVEAHKHWLEEDGRLHATSVFLTAHIGEGDGQLIDQYEAEVNRLTQLQATEGLEPAMHAAEELAVSNGLLDPERDDPRLFTEGPPDPFKTLLEYDRLNELRQPVDRRATNEMDDPLKELEGDLWFETRFEHATTPLLQPVHDTVNYAVVLQSADPWTEELAVEKYWREPDGELGIDSLTLRNFDPRDDLAREQAETERESLLQTHATQGLEALMHQAELAAVQQGHLDADRLDPRLFTDGPPDRFETLAQQLEGEINPYWNTDGEKIEPPIPEASHPRWELDTLPVNDPNGEPLGHALHMLVYPDAEPIQLLEMAHFETTEAADKFGQDFKGYLIPDMLEGPELAVEVARLEGLPTDWKSLEGDDLKAYQQGELTLTRDPADAGAWHPYNPNAERDARIEAEGVYHDPLERDSFVPPHEWAEPELDF